MKLSEQELSQIFQEHTQRSNHANNIGDCLLAPSVSNAESVATDFNAAQAAKLAIHMKPWSEQVGHDLMTSQQPTWSQRIKNVFNQWRPESPLAVSALAVVFTLSAVVFLSNHQTQITATNTNVVTNDVINSLPFEGDNDRLSKGDFDGSDEEDQLFRANFS